MWLTTRGLDALCPPFSCLPAPDRRLQGPPGPWQGTPGAIYLWTWSSVTTSEAKLWPGGTFDLCTRGRFSPGQAFNHEQSPKLGPFPTWSHYCTEFRQNWDIDVYFRFNNYQLCGVVIYYPCSHMPLPFLLIIAAPWNMH